MEVTVTFAPLTAFPCASVAVPIMLPKTAWPEAVCVHRLQQKQNTARATHTDRRAITPLLKPILESFRTRTHRSRTASSTEFIWVRELLCGPQKSRTRNRILQDPLDEHRYFSKPSIPG